MIYLRAKFRMPDSSGLLGSHIRLLSHFVSSHGHGILY
jgi:hypothetical protein